jgi:hypothetical protein
MKKNANLSSTIIFTCALVLTLKSSPAATFPAASAKQSDVQAAINHAKDGGTIVVPSTFSLPICSNTTINNWNR